MSAKSVDYMFLMFNKTAIVSNFYLNNFMKLNLKNCLQNMHECGELLSLPKAWEDGVFSTKTKVMKEK